MSYSSPSDITKDFLHSAVLKSQLALPKLIVYSVLGGAFVSLGGLLAITIAGGMPGVSAVNPGITKFIFGAVFPVGLIMIVIGGAQLFTSDCAVLPYGFFHNKVTFTKVINVWTTVYLSNFAGAILVAYFFAYQADLFAADPWKSFVINLAEKKTSLSFFKVFIKAVGANWLVCMAVWMSYAAKDVTGKILAMWFPVMCFVALGLEHSIANMFFIPTAMLLGASINTYDFLIANLLPATLGNIVGGAILVALVYWFMFSDSAKSVKVNGVKNGHAKALTNLEKRLN